MNEVRLLIFLGVLSLLLAVTPAVSQVNETKWTANIPFDFIVVDYHLPAGHYLVTSNARTMRLTVTNKATGEKGFVFTNDIEKLTPTEKTVLIFEREGDRHVLHQIWGENESHGHDVVHGQDVIELTRVK